MFTGIIEHIGEIKSVEKEGTNRHFEIHTPFVESIKVDQSIAHEGVCLTVTDILSQSPESGATYRVTAVEETLSKTNLGSLDAGDCLNIERCMRVGDRLDGHFVQGHVDAVGRVIRVEERDGSWMYTFGFDPQHRNLLVDKGSVCINGVSLTVVKSDSDRFSVTIIPFTYDHTTFQYLKEGDPVNLEFDILGKYILKTLNNRS